MTPKINFKDIFTLLREWFDTPTPAYADFESWRHTFYEEVAQGKRRGLPFKTWWPHYTDGDFRLEQIIGALLVHQVSWNQVRRGIENIQEFLRERGLRFDALGIANIPLVNLEGLIRSTGFYRQKARRINGFCRFISDNYGNIEAFFEKEGGWEMGKLLEGLGMGFGKETRDCVLLYSANIPVFIGDSYARELLRRLGAVDPNGSGNYTLCQTIYQDGIHRDFEPEALQEVVADYTPDELMYALPNIHGEEAAPSVLLYQQFHAGIDELGISKRLEEFADQLK